MGRHDVGPEDIGGAVDPERVADLTSALVAIPSHEDESAVQAFLQTRFEEAGFSCTLPEAEAGRPNLLAVRGEGGPFLCSHADTHPPHEHPDPFDCRIEDGVLIGRGVVDAKGQIAALVAAVEAAPASPAVVLVTCDEEHGGLGSERAEIPDALRPADGGIVLEPTAFRVCIAQAGAIDLTIDALGSPTHTYAAERGVSALDVVLGALDALEGCSFLRAAHPLLPPPRRHVGRLHAGEHLWRLPARASAEVALGLVPPIDPEAARAEVVEILDALARGWRPSGAELRYDVLDVCEPLELPPDLGVIGRLEAALGAEPDLAGMPSWTDAGNLLVHHGIPCVVFGAGDLASAHSDQEWVRLADLVRLAEILRTFLGTVP